jgi:hypothetical protein
MAVVATARAADTVKQTTDERTVFHVAPAGNDAWSGTLSGPDFRCHCEKAQGNRRFAKSKIVALNRIARAMT